VHLHSHERSLRLRRYEWLPAHCKLELCVHVRAKVGHAGEHDDQTSIRCVDAFGDAFMDKYSVNSAFYQLVSYNLHVG
jgi:hypothetical protein